ncbi:hypothetical protein K458DRAFT_412721 [Lentithecium fluviatile CBS 122367]|uniref:Lysine-specific metallo-endopeptidase domain-containing protein n=1 Tax=Lentithecium fluviatile CBS 122367 TaxID=1168545 RepID=A0A6G1JI65_9PLEO|nr:hypothetical protein K458DRAFT_412721 [Lentithecium fluviatile CBS 122367]
MRFSMLRSCPLWALYLTLILIFQASSQVQAYAIDHSCKPYDTDNVDKTTMLSSAMAEAQAMATLAKDAIIGQFDWLDDSKLLLFPLAQQADYVEVQGYYQTLLDAIPWSVTELNSLTQDKLTIYCGDANFVPYDTDNALGSSWIDLTTSFVFSGPAHAGSSSANFCGSGAIAQTLNHGHILNPTSNPGESDIQVLILCDAALVKGTSTDTIENVSRGTLKEMYGKGELFLGRAITNIGYQHALSWTVLHELLHAAMTNTMLKGSDEVYGWDECTSYSGLGGVATITLDKAKKNCDTLAYYAMTLQIADIDSDLFFTAGVLGSRNMATQAILNSMQPQQNIWGNPNP